MTKIKVDSIVSIQIQNKGEEDKWWNDEKCIDAFDYTYDLRTVSSYRFQGFIEPLPEEITVGCYYLGGEEREKFFRIKSIDNGVVYIEVLADLTKDKLEILPEAMEKINVYRT